jgi:hypothetical protein
MPVILLALVAVVWIAILGRGMVRRRTVGGDGTTSISDFHQQLRVLEHSSPSPIVAPAYRLRAIGGREISAEEAEGTEQVARPVLTVVGAKDLPRPALAFLGQGTGDEPDPAEPAGHRHALGAPSPGRQVVDASALPDDPSSRPRARLGVGAPDPVARRAALRRRRDILAVLTGVFFVTMLLGLIPGASMLWTLTALSGLALTAYVVLLVQIRRRADERERKLRYLDSWADDAVLTYPDRMVGRYAHPSHGAASAR